MNPRSYEATSDEFPDLFPAFKEPDNHFATSSYHAFKSIIPKIPNIWFFRYRRVHFRHTFGGITSTQVDIFLREFDTF